MIPHNAPIVVADGTGARLFRNTGQGGSVSLSIDGELKPSDLLNEGPRGQASDILLEKGDGRSHVRETASARTVS
jgi:hypothetical protein